MQPGDTITPGSSPDPAKDSNQPTAEPKPVLPEEKPTQPVDPDPFQAQNPQPPSPQEDSRPPVNDNPANWQFNPADSTPPALTPENSAPITWTASEYVSHDKNILWFLYVIIAVVATAGLIYLITRELISSLAIFVVGIAFSAFAARPPRVLNYSVDSHGLSIDQKHYPYSSFKSFSVIQDAAVRSIILMPLQRFGLPITIYFDPSDEQKIVETLGGHLPYENRRPSPIDNFMRRIRF